MTTRNGPEVLGRIGELRARAGELADERARLPNVLFVGSDAEELYTQATRAGGAGRETTALFRKVLHAGKDGAYEEGAGTNGGGAGGNECGCAGRAESFIEAILVAGQGIDFDIIIAGIGEELGHLQRAVQSLRTVCPKGRLVLLSRPEDEPMARRALAWGAGDYHILPITLDKILAAVRPPTAAATNLATPPRNTTADAGNAAVIDGQDVAGRIKLSHLPLVVQTTMIDALLQGRANLAARGVAILQTYLTWPGTLEWHPQAHEIPAAETEIAACAAVEHHRELFGQLVLRAKKGLSTARASAADIFASPPQREPEAAHPLEAWAAQLNQAALWLGAWVALERQDEQLRSLAITDELSGAYNRRYFHTFVTGLLEKARVERFRVTLLLFDIDNFKTYNDRFGHAAGDAIIRQLIQLLRHCTREHDVVARIGGDEFAVVFWDSEAPRQPNSEHPRDAVAATERLRQAMEKHDWQEGCKIQGAVSISGGIASFPWDADSLESLLAKADAALLRAKGQGKNVVLLHGDCAAEEAK